MAFISTYKEIKKTKSSLKKRVRDGLRQTILSSISSYYKATGKFERSYKKNRIQFLYFHHIFKDEEKKFIAFLNKLREHHYFLSYSEAVEKLLNEKIDKPYIVFSSDDGFLNNLRAAEILSDFGISACFFVIPEMIETADYGKIQHFNKSKLDLPPIEYLAWNDLEKLKQMGHEIGSHTVTHAKLSEISLAEAREEIEKSRELLAEKIGPVDHFSWPYGRFHHFNAEAKQMVFNSGYKSCASAERGCHIKFTPVQISQNKLCIRRDIIFMGWPLETNLYFIARNAQQASENNHYFPY